MHISYSCKINFLVLDTTYYCLKVVLKAPRYVMLNGTAALQCHYDINDTEVYKIEWLRGGNKIYQYIKGRNPPFNNFSIVGADIDVSIALFVSPIRTCRKIIALAMIDGWHFGGHKGIRNEKIFLSH